MELNVMMDPKPMYPEMFHPRMTFKDRSYKDFVKHYNRTARPVKYYYIDFGISRRFNLVDGPPRALPIQGGDKTAPEILKSNGQALDPFPTDIYYLGNMIKRNFLEVTAYCSFRSYLFNATPVQVTNGIEFMTSLIEDMVQEDPTKRPTIDEVVRRYEAIRHSLAWWKLRSRLKENKELEVTGMRTFLDMKHFFRTVGHLLLFRNSVPTP